MKKGNEQDPDQERSERPCEVLDLFLKSNGEPLPDFMQLAVRFLF